MNAVPDTSERILDAAAALFGQRGYASTTTRAIAERAGVNEVTLFRRFESKLGVLKALGRRFAEQAVSRQVEQMPDPTDTRATLLAIARNEVRASIDNGGVALRLAFDARSVPEVAELIGEGPRANLEGLAAYITLRQDVGDMRDDVPAMVLAEAFSSLTSSYVMYRMVMRFLDAEEPEAAEATVEQLFDVFWSGAAADQQRQT